MPRYEYAYFTKPCSAEEIITPSEIIFMGDEEHVFRRGDREYIRLWRAGISVLKRLNKYSLNKVSDLEEETFLEGASSKINFVFSTPLPIDFLIPELSSLELNIQKAAILSDEHYYFVILEGEEKYWGRIFMNLDEQLLGNFLPQRSSPHLRLHDIVALDLTGESYSKMRNGKRKMIKFF